MLLWRKWHLMLRLLIGYLILWMLNGHLRLIWELLKLRVHTSLHGDLRSERLLLVFALNGKLTSLHLKLLRLLKLSLLKCELLLQGKLLLMRLLLNLQLPPVLLLCPKFVRGLLLLQFYFCKGLGLPSLNLVPHALLLGNECFTLKTCFLMSNASTTSLVGCRRCTECGAFIAWFLDGSGLHGR